MKVLKLARYFIHRTGERKSAAISKVAFSLTTLSLSCIACTLIQFSLIKFQFIRGDFINAMKKADSLFGLMFRVSINSYVHIIAIPSAFDMKLETYC